jgi:AcrR family transcriptional regulator
LSTRKRLTADARRELIERAATELFGERGYQRTSMEDIARGSGVSVPVVYDHFASKQDLHRRLLERHFAELRALWRDRIDGEPSAEQLAGALDAWFAYVESHPFAWRMLFREKTGDPEIEAIHREVAAQSRAALLPMFARERATATVAGSDAAEAIDMVWEVFRAVLQGLALWWYEHPHVPRERVVATAMNAIWIGFERARRGETWSP